MLKVPYMECSAKLDYNVTEVFKEVLQIAERCENNSPNKEPTSNNFQGAFKHNKCTIS